MSVQDNGVTRQFETGASRDTGEGKLDFEGFLSHEVLVEFAKYMHENRSMADGSVRDSDNWQKGMPLEVYMKSAWRHFVEWWSLHRVDQRGSEAQIRALCAMMFNVQGYMLEALRANRRASEGTRERRPSPILDYDPEAPGGV